jgi:hypothetical protein
MTEGSRLGAMREKRLFRIVVGVLLLPLLLGVATADAKKKKKKPKSAPVTVVSATKSTSADGELATVAATCPAGKIAVGGGFTSPLLISETTLTDLYIVYESRRLGDNAWQVSAGREHSSGAAPSVPLTAIADCRSTTLTPKKAKRASTAKKKKKRKLLRVTEVSATGVSAGNIQQSTASAVCPAGTQAIGGGFSSSPAPMLTGSNSFPVFFANYRSSPTTWFSGFTNSGSINHTATSYAYCAAGLKLKETSAAFTVPASSMAGIQSKTLPTPSCPKGLALLGGGFNSTPPMAGGPLPIWTRFGPAGPTWEVGMYNVSPVTDDLTSLAYCA